MVKIIGFLAPLSTVERKAGITSDQFETTKQNDYNYPEKYYMAVCLARKKGSSPLLFGLNSNLKHSKATAVSEKALLLRVPC